MLEASFTFQSYVERLTDAQLEALLFDAHAEEIKRHEQANRQTTGDPRRRWLPKALVLLALALPLAGCINAVELSKHLSKPKVVLATLGAWRCDQQTKLPSKYGMEECSRCTSIARGPEVVTINDVAHEVTPKQGVVICATQALVEQ
jgi:hypothetical protein